MFFNFRSRIQELFTVQEMFGSLGEAQKIHFNDGGMFDKIYSARWRDVKGRKDG